jgi:hypothetical protein
MNEINVEQLQEMWEEFIVDATKFEVKGNKSAGRRARLKSLELRTLMKNWRATSLK